MNFLLHRKIAICMLFIALTGLGYVSYKQLPVELLPNAELPMLFVQVTSAQDMDPSYVESEVVIPIEGAIGTIGGVEQIESLIDSRQSSIKIDFKSNINFKITALKLQEKINEIASSLPEGFTVQVQKIDVSMLAGGFMSLQVANPALVDFCRDDPFDFLADAKLPLGLFFDCHLLFLFFYTQQTESPAAPDFRSAPKLISYCSLAAMVSIS